MILAQSQCGLFSFDFPQTDHHSVIRAKLIPNHRKSGKILILPTYHTVFLPVNLGKRQSRLDGSNAGSTKHPLTGNLHFWKIWRQRGESRFGTPRKRGLGGVWKPEYKFKMIVCELMRGFAPARRDTFVSAKVPKTIFRPCASPMGFLRLRPE